VARYILIKTNFVIMENSTRDFSRMKRGYYSVKTTFMKEDLRVGKNRDWGV
jgi:hypothetical protein